MKIRTDQELFDKMDGELSWRRTDISRLRGMILTTEKSNSLLYKTLLRSSIPMIYAHWEGFIKEVALSYLNYISMRKFSYKLLNKGVLSLYVQNQFISTTNKTSFEKALAICDFFENRLDEKSNVKSIPDPIKTKSNLNSEVLKEIVQILDLNYEKFRGFEAFIDSRLLEARNKIAHGEYREIDWEFYDEAQKIVILLIEEFKDQIENNVVQKKHLKLSA